MMRILVLAMSLVVMVSSFQHDPAQPMQRIHHTTTAPPRLIEPPFPNGPCGGRVVTLSPMDLFFGKNELIPPRSIQVWLPPNYNTNSEDRFPVLYCHDGQNSMEDSSSWTGASWRLTGCLERLAERGLVDQIPIVVMLPSATDDLVPGIIRRRHLEYGDVGQVFAEAHADFVAQTVKPFVDNAFCTLTSQEHTFAIGTSLGGQASMHLCLRHPQIFGGAACLSPAFQPMTIAAAAFPEKLKSKRLYIDMGGDMGDAKVSLFKAQDHITPKHWWNAGFFWLDTQLQPSGNAMSLALTLARVNHVYTKIPGARHNERAWAQRIHLPLLYLYGKNNQ